MNWHFVISGRPRLFTIFLMKEFRLRNDPSFFSKDCDTVKRPGDEIERSYDLKPEIKWERLQMINSNLFTKDQILAFTIANKAELMYESDITSFALPRVIEYTFQAFKLDPLCVDSLRVMSKLMMKIPQVDNDTIICCYREVLCTFRELVFLDLLYDHQGDAIHQYKLRSYIRLLKDIAYAATISEKSDVAVFAYEELLRADNEDYMSARLYLVLSYLKIIGRSIRTGSVTVKRTKEQLQQLIDSKLTFSDGPLFEGDSKNVVYRWLQLLLAYINKDKEQLNKLAKIEQKKSPNLVRYLFDELKLQYLSEKSDIKKFYEPLHLTLIEWPDFMIEVHNILRKEDKKFNETVYRYAPTFSESSSINYKSQMGKMAFDFLERGRNAQRTQNYAKAITMFTMSKRYFVEAMKPAQRWYLNAPFALLSNRATCAEYCNQWALCRHDTRFTLMMKPDHIRSYQRLPKIAQQFNALKLKEMLEDLFKQVKLGYKDRTLNEWIKISKKAVALISLRAIVLSRIGKLDDEKIEELMKDGVEDMYTSCNVTADVMEPLPWLNDDDIECI